MAAGGARGLRLAYGSNGLGDHRLADACAFLADEGYDGIALTLDHHHLDPSAEDLDARVGDVRRLLTDHGLAVVVETGGRFVLDARRKHHPTLVSTDGAARRVDFYRRALHVAADLGSPVLHLWSGVAPADDDPDEVWDRMLSNLQPVLEESAAVGIPLAFEPEPGMVVDTLDAFDRLAADLGDPAALQMTLDIGHCRCSEPQPEADCIRRVADRLAHVQIEDMRRGVHEHLPFGEGEIDFPPVLAALAEVGYDGLVSVELTRHGHTAHTMVPAAIRFLRAAAGADGHQSVPSIRAHLAPSAATLHDRLVRQVPEEAATWLTDAIARIETRPDAIDVLFPQVSRMVGRGPLDPAADPDDPFLPTVDDAARSLLVATLAADEAVDLLPLLYRHGDAREQRGVLRALDVLTPDVLDPDGPVAEVARDLVDDALRTNDTRLVAAALGPTGVELLDDGAFAQAVLKCLFVGLDVNCIPALPDRTTPELSRMVAAFVHERIAAGRTVPAAVWPIIDAHPPADELAAITAELDHPAPARAAAARAAMALRH